MVERFVLLRAVATSNRVAMSLPVREGGAHDALVVDKLGVGFAVGHRGEGGEGLWHVLACGYIGDAELCLDAGCGQQAEKEGRMRFMYVELYGLVMCEWIYRLFAPFAALPAFTVR